MILPTSVERLMKESLAIMQDDPNHHLPPLQRSRLYDALEPVVKSPALYPIRGWLAIQTAYKVRDAWDKVSADLSHHLEEDLNLPKQLLITAQGVLYGDVTLTVAYEEANTQWNYVGNLLLVLYKMPAPLHRAFYACDAALRALCESVGMEPLKRHSVVVDQRDDGVFDAGQRDTASSAVLAHAGAEWLPPIDLQKRQEFWEWWLTIALPSAWIAGTRGEEPPNLEVM